MRNAPRIVVASQNAGKCREIARILEGFDVISLAGFDPVAFPEEGGDYVENARAKALAAARATGLPCVADDSGLEVECLGGAPGPYSARYGGPGLDDRGRVDHLLKSIEGEPSPRRARFFCVAAAALPDGRSEIAEGACAGEILTAPRGGRGFGYDPIFRPEGHTRSLAELDRQQKDALSHRGKAFRALVPKLVRLLGAAGD
jgi:XTP/dITP diphosphohydrolase